mgnify:CR=1 FL=1
MLSLLIEPSLILKYTNNTLMGDECPPLNYPSKIRCNGINSDVVAILLSYYLDFPFSMENRENSLFLITSGTSIKGSEFAKENILIKLHFNLSLQTDY